MFKVDKQAFLNYISGVSAEEDDNINRVVEFDTYSCEEAEIRLGCGEIVGLLDKGNLVATIHMDVDGRYIIDAVTKNKNK